MTEEEAVRAVTGEAIRFPNYYNNHGFNSRIIIIFYSDKAAQLTERLTIMIERTLRNRISSRLADDKAIVIMGARQVGKTTLLHSLLDDKGEVLWLSGDEPDVRMLFEGASSSRLRAFFGSKRYVAIDEAQRIEDIGIKLKLITDSIKDVKLIATGSSSFELADKVNESLAGRKWEYMLYPLSFGELVAHHGLLEERRLLAHRLVFGSYPQVVLSPGSERELLGELSGSILYKDILRFEGIKGSDKLQRLMQALAYQVGNIVSYSELAQVCGISAKTAERYIDILEKAYIVFRLGSFSRNLRNELKKSRKIYFYDNGIRNALIADFRPAETRTDVGALWENYLVSERRKSLSYRGILANTWFWRTAQKQEIDYLEEYDGKLRAREFKWGSKREAPGKRAFLNAYPESELMVVNRENYDLWLEA
jgi:predicted AAA+ superfamily ATPase